MQLPHNYKHVLAAALVIIIVLCYFGWSYLDKKAVDSSKLTISGGEAVQSSPAAQSNINPQLDALENLIYVDISGGVVKPGLYSIDKNKRLADLLELAGGVSKYADTVWVTQKLNLANKLKDSEKIYIPFASDRDTKYIKESLNLICSDTAIPTVAEVQNEDTSGESEAATDKLNVNTATKNQLIDLPGIGEVTADKIISNRPFSDLADFYEKTKIGASTKEKLTNLIMVDAN